MLPLNNTFGGRRVQSCVWGGGGGHWWIFTSCCVWRDCGKLPFFFRASGLCLLCHWPWWPQLHRSFAWLRDAVASSIWLMPGYYIIRQGKASRGPLRHCSIWCQEAAELSIRKTDVLRWAKVQPSLGRWLRERGCQAYGMSCDHTR